MSNTCGETNSPTASVILSTQEWDSKSVQRPKLTSLQLKNVSLRNLHSKHKGMNVSEKNLVTEGMNEVCTPYNRYQGCVGHAAAFEATGAYRVAKLNKTDQKTKRFLLMHSSKHHSAPMSPVCRGLQRQPETGGFSNVSSPQSLNSSRECSFEYIMSNTTRASPEQKGERISKRTTSSAWNMIKQLSQGDMSKSGPLKRSNELSGENRRKLFGRVVYRSASQVQMIDPQFQLTEPQGFINNAGRFRSELAYFGSTRAHRESHSSNGTISINPTTSVDKSVDSKDDEYYAPDFVPKSTGLQPDSVTELQAQYSIKLSVGSDFNSNSTSHSTAAEFTEDYFLFDSYPPALSGWNNPSIKSASSAVHLENPERETRWYFKYFLGKYHQLYCGYVTERDPFLLAIAKSHVQSYGISQYRAILWRKTGSQKLCISYNPTTSLTAKKVLNFFDIHRIEKGPKEANNAEVQKDALTLEEQEGSVNFKFGVLYCKEGQTSDEQMYNNERGSEEFDRFVKLLGDQICLKSWDRFKGGLDTKSDTTGSYSVYTVYEGHEIMFHVSTMLPFSSEHRQQIERKRHVGNDIVNIIFVDGVEPDRQPSWMPSMMKTHFTHIFAIVTYHKETVTYKLNVFAEESVPIFGPPLPNPAEFTDPNEFREFLLVKLINGEKAAFHSPVFAQKRERTLEMLLNVICSSNLNEAGAGTLSRRTFGDAVIDSFNGITTTKEQNRVDEYIRYGQNLKLNTIIRGDAPTSSITIGRSKINPWQPTRFNTSFHVEVVCGDSWGDHLIVSGEAGSFLLKDKGSPTPLIDRSIEVRQLEVVNQQDIMVIRYDKGKDSRLAVVYLTNLDLSSPMDRSQVKKLSLERSRGCQLFALSKSIVQPLKLAIVLHKRIVIYQWQMITGHSLSSWNQITQMDSPNSFEFLRELPILDPIQTMTFVEGIPGGRLCVGHRNQFDLIDERNREIAQIFRTESSRNQVISAHEVWSEDEPELILCFTRTCHFQKISSLQLQCCSTRKMHLPSSLSSDSNPPVSSTSNPRSPLFEQGSSSAPACSIGPCTAPSSPPNSQLSPEAHGPSIQPWSLANSIDRHKGTEFDFTWNVEPEQIVISCPYIFVFTSTSIELRLINNGSLVHTMLVPNCKLLSSKCGIFFTSTSENLDNTCSPSGLRLVSRQSGGDLGPVREGTQGTDNESATDEAFSSDEVVNRSSIMEQQAFQWPTTSSTTSIQPGGSPTASATEATPSRAHFIYRVTFTRLPKTDTVEESSSNRQTSRLKAD